MSISTRLSKFLSESEINFNYEIEGLQIDPEKTWYERSKSYTSFNHLPKEPFNVKFLINFDIEKLKVVCPESERSSIDSIFEVLIEIQSYTSRKTEIVNLALDTESHSIDSSRYFIGYISIDPEDWMGELSFKAFIIRSKETASESLYLTKPGHILGQSMQQKIYLDGFSENEGSGDLDVRVDSSQFQDDKNILYKLIDSDRVVAINAEKDPELNALFTSKTKTGILAITRRALFAPIAADIIEQLARKAFAKMCNDVYENPTVIPLDPSDYPYSQVADDIARALNPGSTIEDAVNHLVDLLESNDTREKLINEQLPLLVQRISKRGLKNCYKEIAENAVNRNRQRVRNND
jgi:hypothetical protein